MSDCRHGGRDVYERPETRVYDHSKPIRGYFAFADGTTKLITMARYVNGTERHVCHVVIDGVRYVPERRRHHEESIEWMNE